ncbi:hypothetical protein NG99_01670 [Erwinia typographi]|uniref:Uncharacterized protein n=1 Tax=Erwinia typographi TaxID=371042 RepID=A0A0A3ZAF8_9GAMM|nr:hypothetical protein [Erwinia typographi]KGT95875.1 hypothetical protein NG99_01670 [Erwinia typographi]
MMIKLKIIVASMVMLTAFSSFAATNKSSMTCKDSALRDAKKLLSFYRDNDDRISIDDKVTPRPQIKNPQNASQTFDVLETWGYIYKGKYRMRLTYYSAIDCTLMGEDILEYADL